MHPLAWRMSLICCIASACLAQSPATPGPLTWQQVQERFRANNPTLLAGQLTIDEARAQEVSAYLRPNPQLGFGLDQLTPFETHPLRPLWQVYPSLDISYLHERAHKRELRRDSAQGATAIAISDQADLERGLLFSLRDAFVRVLEAKATVEVAKDGLSYYDKVLKIHQDRFNAGAIARVDFQRLELQRLQYVSDLQTAQINLLTAKIDLRQLLRDKTPLDQFDVAETFDAPENMASLDEVRVAALSNRPDLRAAQQSVDKARIDHNLAVANGSTDPVFGLNVSRQATPLNTYLGFSMSIPLRIFDKNQGEKQRTLIDIKRNERLRDAAETAVLHDVDATYAGLQSTLSLLRPYKEKYLKEAEEIRTTIGFSYEHGAASLIDFLDAQDQYRTTRLSYLNLIGAYFSAANQVNNAAGREVIR